MAANFWVSSHCDLLVERARKRAAAAAKDDFGEDAGCLLASLRSPRSEVVAIRQSKRPKVGLTLSGGPASTSGRREGGEEDADGDAAMRRQLKVSAVDFIFKLGKKLKLRQIPLLTACVYVHRLGSWSDFGGTSSPPAASGEGDQGSKEGSQTKEGEEGKQDQAGTMAAMAAGLKLAALSCVYLACKVEETPVTIDRILKCARSVPFPATRTAAAVAEEKEGKAARDGGGDGGGDGGPSPSSPALMPDQIIIGELLVLEVLNHSLKVHHPHTLVMKYCELLASSAKRKNAGATSSAPAARHGGRSIAAAASKGDSKVGASDLLELAWLLLTDSYHTDLCVRFPPHLIALGCLYMAGGLQGRTDLLPFLCSGMEGCSPADEREVRQVCEIMVKFYTQDHDSDEPTTTAK